MHVLITIVIVLVVLGLVSFGWTLVRRADNWSLRRQGRPPHE